MKRRVVLAHRPVVTASHATGIFQSPPEAVSRRCVENIHRLASPSSIAASVITAGIPSCQPDRCGAVRVTADYKASPRFKWAVGFLPSKSEAASRDVDEDLPSLELAGRVSALSAFGGRCPRECAPPPLFIERLHRALPGGRSWRQVRGEGWCRRSQCWSASNYRHFFISIFEERRTGPSDQRLRASPTCPSQRRHVRPRQAE